MEDANATFDTIKQSFSEIFNDMELPVKSLQADNGVMGGSKSCEFQCVCGIGEDRIVHCQSCNYESLYPSSVSYAKSIDYFDTDEYGKLMCDLDVLTTKDDFNALMNAHPEVTQMFSVFTIHHDQCDKQIVIPKGRSFFAFLVYE